MQFIDLGAQRARIGNRIKAAVDRVIDSGKYILGPEVTQFEKELAAYTGVRNVIACANGTDALLAQIVQANLGEIGITVKLTGLETLAFLDRAFAIDADMTL